MSHTRYESIRSRVVEFTKKYELGDNEVVISGDAAFLPMADKGYRNWPFNPTKKEVIRLLLSPSLDLDGKGSNITEHGLWCGALYSEGGHSAPTGMGVFSDDSITALVDPFWPDMTPVLFDGLLYVPIERLIQIPGLSSGVKLRLRKMIFRTKELGRELSEEETEYLDKAVTFDEFYHHSDDPAAWRAGKERSELLRELASRFSQEHLAELTRLIQREKQS